MIWPILGVLMVLVVMGALLAWGLLTREQLRLLAEQNADANRLRQETVQQNLQLYAFADKVRVLEQEMGKLRQYDRKLRAMTGKAPLVRGGIPPNVGGSDRDATSAVTSFAGRTDVLVRQLHRDLDRLLAETSLREQSQQELGEFLESSKSILASTPDIWPVRGPVTSTFGYRSLGGALSEFHRGLDIISPVGTPIIAPADGIVVSSEWTSGYGLILVVNHGYGLVTRYAHLSETYVEEGRKVKRGEKIAAVGMTGRTSGSHLHYEVVLNGIPVNPMGFLQAKQ